MGQKVYIYVTRRRITRAIGKAKMLLASCWKSSPASHLNQDSLVHTMNSEIISSSLRPISLFMHRIATESL